MCLAIPARVVELLPALRAVVDLAGVRKEVSIDLVDDVQVIGPDNKVIREESKSGFFKANGEDLAYSSKSTINYDREAMKVCINFDKPASYDYTKGDYRVIVFCEGYDIGNSKFSVK